LTLFFAKKHLAVKWHYAASKTRRNQTKRQKPSAKNMS
jgi:hypothetical protein